MANHPTAARVLGTLLALSSSIAAAAIAQDSNSGNSGSGAQPSATTAPATDSGNSQSRPRLFRRPLRTAIKNRLFRRNQQQQQQQRGSNAQAPQQ